MALIRINRDPPPRQLRVFGLLWWLAFSFLGYVIWKKSGLTWPVGAIWSMAILVPAVGMFYLPLLRWSYLGLAYVTYPIGFVVSHVVLALVYFAVITPIGLIMRILGRDSMHRRFDASRDSYWIERDPPTDPRRYFRQF